MMKLWLIHLSSSLFDVFVGGEVRGVEALPLILGRWVCRCLRYVCSSFPGGKRKLPGWKPIPRTEAEEEEDQRESS